jgi:hypothetical protein
MNPQKRTDLLLPSVIKALIAHAQLKAMEMEPISHLKKELQLNS